MSVTSTAAVRPSAYPVPPPPMTIGIAIATPTGAAASVQPAPRNPRRRRIGGKPAEREADDQRPRVLLGRADHDGEPAEQERDDVAALRRLRVGGDGDGRGGTMVRRAPWLAPRRRRGRGAGAAMRAARDDEQRRQVDATDRDHRTRRTGHEPERDERGAIADWLVPPAATSAGTSAVAVMSATICPRMSKSSDGAFR